VCEHRDPHAASFTRFKISSLFIASQYPALVGVSQSREMFCKCLKFRNFFRNGDAWRAAVAAWKGGGRGGRSHGAGPCRVAVLDHVIDSFAAREYEWSPLRGGDRAGRSQQAGARRSEERRVGKEGRGGGWRE